MTIIPDSFPLHSPLGGSSMARAIKCPGSVVLGYGCVDEESEFASLGTAAHAFGEACLVYNKDGWECVGFGYAESTDDFYRPGDNRPIPEDIVWCDKEMADAVQEYLDHIRAMHPERTADNAFVEQEFYCPTLHKYFWGKSDFAYVNLPMFTLDVWDYKHGAGIMVEAKGNVQNRYYAAGILEQLGLWDKIKHVRMHIVQPRGWMEAHRWDEIEVGELREWVDWTLLPAMDRALQSKATQSGEHCRFCPVRSYACPQIEQDMERLAKMTDEIEKGGAEQLSNEQVALYLHLLEVAKIAGKAAEQTAFKRLQAGAEIKCPERQYKLVAKRVNREWKDGAEREVKKKFGPRALTQPALKSPAQIDKLPGGSQVTARWAQKPSTGLTVAATTDSRRPIDRSTKSMFKPVQKGKK